MRLVVLGSSSHGNGYLLDDGQRVLLIEAGMPLTDVQKIIDYNVCRVDALLLTHEHGDHAHYIQQYLSAQIPTYCSEGTAHALHIAYHPCVHTIAPLTRMGVARYAIVPFAICHDAAEPLGFLLHHPHCGTTLFATDTAYLHNTFGKLNNILIECDYCDDLLDRAWERGDITKGHYERIVANHLSLTTCREMLHANDISAVNNIVLLHLSDSNSNAEIFRNDIAAATGKTVTIASKGTIIDPFNITPF